jgi:DNA-binding CsgD family transcriptional regulator
MKKKAILALLLSGISVREICNILSVSRQYVYKIKKNHGKKK